ncbi:hypothetical protein D9M72_401500 [compost metagenome]
MVHALQRAVGLPCGEFPGKERVVLRRALAEQQPVAALPGRGAGLELGAQPSQPGAVADQDQWPVIGRRVEAAVGTDAQRDAGAHGRVLGQPA